MTFAFVLDTISQMVLTIVLALIPVTVPIVLKKLFDKWGATADQARREAVTTAIVSGLTQALDKRGRKADDGGLSPEGRQAIANEAAAYAKLTVPDTIRKLEITDGNLPKLAMARIPIVLKSLSPVSTPPPTTAEEKSRPGQAVPQVR